MTSTEFQANINKIQADLFSLAMNFAKDYADAKDLVQDAITKAFKNKHRFKAGSNFKAWISKILYRGFINEYQKRKRRRKVVVSKEEWLPVLNNTATSEQTESSIILQELEQLVSQLDIALRAPFMMHFEGYAYKEIAEALGLPIGTIKSRIFYARKILRKRIKHIYGGYPLEIAA